MKWKRVKVLNITVIILCLIIGVGVWLWFGESGFIRLYRTESERQAYIERIRDLARENQALLDEVHRLRTDMEYVESVARRQLDLVKKNEVIYRFDDTGQSPKENPPERSQK
ncbi:MAG: FtsB family cell division protein [Thermodesulfobacteriota bacterium]